MPPWVPYLRTQNRRKPPFEMPGHRKGCDYDCGDADRDMVPAIEGSFVLRMIPGRDCDNLRKIIENGELNTDSAVSLEFKAQRKVILKIRTRLYAAQRNSTSNC
jgi:transcription initiation factor TFIID subunit 7